MCARHRQWTRRKFAKMSRPALRDGMAASQKTRPGDDDNDWRHAGNERSEGKPPRWSRWDDWGGGMGVGWRELTNRCERWLEERQKGQSEGDR